MLSLYCKILIVVQDICIWLLLRVMKFEYIDVIVVSVHSQGLSITSTDGTLIIAFVALITS